MHRRLAVLGRVLLFAARYKPAWVAGTATLSLAKILENMEIGHNVMHGQWDWMHDPYIHSSSWDWDSASTPEAWKHSHNYIHHTYTNIRGKDKDLGYKIMRIDPHQKWLPIYLLQPFYNVLLMAFFEWGVAFHDLDLDAIRKGEKSSKALKRELKGMARKAGRQIAKDYIAYPLLSGRKGFKSTLTANFTANVIRNMWAHAIIFCGHFPDQTYTFSEEEVADETAGASTSGSCSAPPTSRAARSSTSSAATSATRSSTTSTPTCRAPATPRSPRRSRRSASATSCPTTADRSSSSGARCSGRSCGSRCPAAARGPSRGRTTASQGRPGDAEGVGAEDLRRALLVEDVELGDGEAGAGQQVDDRAREVAAAEQPLLDGLEAVLPAAHALVRRQPVLEEVQRPAGLEDAPQLAQRGGDVGDGAQRPGREGGVEAVVGERQRLAVQPGPPHRDARRGDALARQLPADVGRLDGGDLRDGRRVERDVQAGAEADLDDVAREARADPAAQRLRPP